MYRRLNLLLAGWLAMVAFAPITPTDEVLAASPSPPAPPSRHLLLAPSGHVELRGLAAASTVARPSASLPFLPRDRASFQAEQQLANQGQTGRRSGVVAVPVERPQVAVAAASQAPQQLAGFPIMDLSRQVLLYGANQNVAPPDTQLAAGPTYLVEADNSVLSAWSKSGTLVFSADLNVFFNVPAGYGFTDPRIVYDAESGRWFLSGLAVTATNNSKVYLAVSTTSDPTGTWILYLIASGVGILGDQPMTGVNSDKVVISWNDFTGSSPGTATFSGQETWVLQKSDLVSGVSVHIQSFGPDPNRFRVVPAQSLTPTATAWLSYNNADCPTWCTTGSPKIGVVAITGTPTANTVAWSERDLAIRGTTLPPSPRQPSGVPVTQAIDDRFLSAVWQGGMFWVSGNDGCVPAGETTTRSCMRLVEISTVGTPTVAQDFDVGQNGVDLYYPAVTLNSFGDLFIGYSASSPTMFPSALAVDSLAASPRTLENPVTLASGLNSYASGSTNRWGDYSAATQDPSNPAHVWVTAEYQASATDAGNWGTATGRLVIQPSITAASPSAGPLAGGTPVTIAGSHFQPGAAVSFGSNPATNVVVVSGTRITVTAPPGSAPGPVNVTVSQLDGTAVTASSAYTYTVARPTVTSIVPNNGPPAGGSSVTITGTNLTWVTAVKFGSTAAAGFSVVNDTTVTAVSPVQVVSTVDVTVTSAGGTSATSISDQFTFTGSTIQYFPWYDLASPGMRAETIHLLNPSVAAANITVTMPGAFGINLALAAGQENYVSFGQGHIGGPVVVNSDQPVVASLRAWYYQSFNETPARPASAAATVQYFPWYDLASPGMIADTIHITNVSAATATGTIALPGATALTFSVNSGQDAYFSFPGGTIGGPVTLTSSQPVLASLRAWYYQSFNEVPGRPATAAATTQYFPWYDNSSPGVNADTIHITNVSGSTASGTIALPGATSLNFNVPSGQDAYFAFPYGTIGGPVTITSSQPVLASLRAWYYQSFNEVPGRSATAAATTQYFPWYDNASPGVRADTIHITNVSGSTASGTIALPGAATINFSVTTGQDAYFAFPGGTIGGAVTITSSQPVLASLRAWYYQSFNEVPGYR